MEKRVMIIGAGKIGRGYLADLFGDAGYHIIFVDAFTEMVDKLNEAGKYTLFISGEGKVDKKIISNYEAYSCERDFDRVVEIIADLNIICVSLYPSAFPSVADQLSEAIKLRIKNNNKKPLNVFFFANKVFTARKMKELITERLDSEIEKNYFMENVGIIEALTVRGGVKPTDEMLAEDPLCVSSSEGRILKVGDNIIGEKPDMPFMEYLDKMEGRLAKKVWCGNMLHCTMSAIGNYKGYKYNIECSKDNYIKNIIDKAFDEADFGVGEEFGFTPEEMLENKQHYFDVFWNCKVKDDIARLAADPMRKLSYDDRYIGPALLCLKRGKLPYFLARSAAYLLMYDNEEDPVAIKMQKMIKEKGIKQAIPEICGLNLEIENENILYQLIYGNYMEICFQNN